MITVPKLLAAIHHIQQHLPPGGVPRWAFLVTFEELASLVDEFQANPEYGMQFESEQAQHIKEGRAALNVNGTWVMPELMPDDRPPAN